MSELDRLIAALAVTEGMQGRNAGMTQTVINELVSLRAFTNASSGPISLTNREILAAVMSAAPTSSMVAEVRGLLAGAQNQLASSTGQMTAAEKSVRAASFQTLQALTVVKSRINTLRGL